MTRTILRRALVAGVSLTAAVVLTGCGSDDHSAAGGGHGSPTATDASDAAFASAHNAADVMFAQMMIPHHQQAVAMADLAAARAADSQVKQLAAQIKDAQAPEIATMSGWLSAWGAPTPPGSGSTGPGSGMPGVDHGSSATPGMSHGGSGMPGMGHGESASPTSSGMPGMDHGMPGMMSDADMARLAAASGRNFDAQFLTMMTGDGPEQENVPTADRSMRTRRRLSTTAPPPPSSLAERWTISRDDRRGSADRISRPRTSNTQLAADRNRRSSQIETVPASMTPRPRSRASSVRLRTRVVRHDRLGD